MNHRILFCLALILGNSLAASANCLDSNPGDVEYDCANDVDDTRHKDESEEKTDDIINEELDYSEVEDPENHENPSETSESTSTTTTTEAPAQESEDEQYDDYDTNSEEHIDPETQQGDANHDSDHGGMQNDTNEDLPATTIETLTDDKDVNNDQHINLFYDAIKSTLMSENYTNAYRYVKHPERVECMISKMRSNNVMDKINKESYVFEKNIEHQTKFEFRNVTTFMYDLEREIQDANFDCTEMGNTRIYILIFVALLAVVLLVLYIRRR